MVPGETIASGASTVCKECKTQVTLMVMKSSAGFYVGTVCKCYASSLDSEEAFTPYTRETGYYRIVEEAEMALTRILNGKVEDLRQ